jgi:Rieske Fe-S protein
LTLVGLLRQRQTSGPQPIAAANEVLEGQAFYFSYPRPDDQAMLLHLPGGRFVAYGQRCTHLSCAAYYEPHNSRVFCPCHEGIFNPETGDPVAGPPPRRLEQIALQQQDGIIYAVGRQP